MSPTGTMKKNLTLRLRLYLTATIAPLTDASPEPEIVREKDAPGVLAVHPRYTLDPGLCLGRCRVLHLRPGTGTALPRTAITVRIRNASVSEDWVLLDLIGTLTTPSLTCQ
jgi:hypothetical protein